MSAEPVPFFKKKKSRPTTARQRDTSPPAASSSSISASQVVLPSKKAAASLLSAGTKRSLTQREKDALELDLDHRADDGPDVKWGASDNKSHINQVLDIIAGDEAEALLAKRRKVGDDDSNEGANDDGQYHGQKGYRQHLAKNKEVPKAMRVGPQRNSSSVIKTATIIDYQPDVCKDYKETGYCGFGDTCKFLHDRGTYLAGWQLDKLAADPKRQAADDTDSDSDEEDIPFACLICRKHYTDPIVTRCGHYFCSACAIKRFAKTPKCAACGQPTGGIFNRADKIIEKMNKTRQEKEDEEEDEEEGGNVEIQGLKGGGAQPSDDESDDSDDS